ncbi:MAG: hypothetical protein MRY21_04725 [Simkaniaceae bacterium]|nr:hypothetical protein [Simkaniaceae bacterium]
MRWILLLALVSAFSNETNISSKSIAVKGDLLFLDGSVRLDHALGVLYAEHIKYDKLNEKATLSEKVHFNFSNNSTIDCEKATLNFQTLWGDVSTQVIYRDILTSHSHPSKLEISCQSARFKMAESLGKKLELDNLTARDDVLIHYDENFELAADYALYRKLDSRMRGESNLPQGMIKLYPRNRRTKCVLSHHDDHIEAKQIAIDTKSSLITMSEADGNLQARPCSETRFSAEQLIWDHKNSTLTMQGHIAIDDPQFGKLRSDDELKIEQRHFEGKYALSTIESMGKIELEYEDAGILHHFIAPGHSLLDRDRLTFTASSSRNDQVLYCRGGVEIRANDAKMTYNHNTSKLRPASVRFEGDVSFTAKQEDVPFERAIADCMIYHIDKGEVILFSSPDRNILFSDPTGEIRMSAEEVVIRQIDGEKEVEAKGKVRCFFTQEETNYYRRIFKHGTTES